MSTLHTTEQLGRKGYVTVILRLLLGRRGGLEQGEMVDLDGTVRARFKGWAGLMSALRKWIATREL